MASKRSAKTDPDVVRIGTRASELALRQARLVEKALLDRGVRSELVTFKTTGDKNLDQPLSEIGAKGLFTHELEVALAKGKIDCAVHSLKDLPTELADGLEIVAQLEREDPRDCVVVNRVTGAEGLDDLPAGSRVGTSSLRRRAQLMARRPDLEVVELRGNVPTRLNKVETGKVHAAILAAAGLIRLEATQRIAMFLDAPGWLPAAGQGAIAIEVSADSPHRGTLASLDHRPTSVATRAERAFLAALEGGCQVPIGALVSVEGGIHTLYGMLSDLTGKHIVRGSRVVDPDSPESSGEDLAAEIRARGGSSLLVELREAVKLPAPQPE
ncbi:MAG TPA: hydroxymethylbilane synthase [Gemmatimonadaceae bacterium]|nr:hydroxymethylbilane synthase [Gemmatimonadaceae bacterium]